MSPVISRANGEHYRWGDGCSAWRLVDTPGLGVVEELVPPGAGETRHRHHRARQVFYILSGAATFELDGVVSRMSTSDTIEVEPGAPHRIYNEGDVDLVFLLVAQPSSRGDREPA
jgi:mannose-6-phosphate isomerase-like protein (cupin superfamily)